MSTFDSTKASLSDLLREIAKGRIQLPDFQRGWIWDDDHIQDLLVSIARSFPIGAVMLLEAGGDVRFQTRPVEGLENKVQRDQVPEKLILDGQQRLTTLTQALSIDRPVHTRTAQGKGIKRYYYFNIQKVVNEPDSLDDAVVAVDENRQQRSDFGRKVDLDLSTTELECKLLHFPSSQIMNSDDWEATLYRVAPEQFGTYMAFRRQVLDAFRTYLVPVIQLQKETSKEAVCLVFEKVNTGGVQLSVFELVTASYAADGYNLRDDWFGSKARDVDSRKERLEQAALLKGIEATDFLQGVSLLHTHEIRRAALDSGKTGKQLRPISAKRADILQLPLGAWKRWADELEEGFRDVARFLRRQYFYSQRELPYRTQLVPLAAVLTRLGERWLEPRIYDKLTRWFWCGVLGELYGGAVETRIANDYEELLGWFEADAALPRTVREANFQPDRFDTLRSRLSAAYKGINVLVLREGAKDWYWKATIQELDTDEIALDIHHIFPRRWCEGKKIGRERYDSILNKTPISYIANRKIGGEAPSRYLPRIQREKHVALNDSEMDELLISHALTADLLRRDAFDDFVEDRRRRLSRLIEAAMGKPVHLSETADYDEGVTAERSADAEATEDAVIGYGAGRGRQPEESKFLEACDEHGRVVLSRILDFADDKGMSVRWGSKGFSMGVEANRTRVVVCYVFPPGTFWSALYDRAGIEKKTAAPADAVAYLQKAAERTGLFEPAGSGQSLKCVIDHPFTEDETNALVAWCESVEQAIWKHAVPGGRPHRTVLSRTEFLESCDDHGRAVYSRIFDLANRKDISLKWATTSFNIVVDVAGVPEPVCRAGVPGSKFGQAVWTALGSDHWGIRKTGAPEEVVEQLWQQAEQTGLFGPAGKELKCLIDRAFTDDEVDALVAWCESAEQAIRKHAVPVGAPSG